MGSFFTDPEGSTGLPQAPGEPGIALAWSSRTPALDLSAGEDMHLVASVRSIGGAGRGMTIEVWGPALDAGLASADRVTLTVGPPAARRTAVAALEGASTPEGAAAPPPHRRLAARFPDLEIPAAPPPIEGAACPTPEQGRRAVDALLEARVHAIVQGRALAPGEAGLHVGFVPAQAPGARLSQETALRVTPAPRRPLRCAPWTDARALRALETPARLVAFVALGADREASARLAAEAMERWASALAPARDGVFYTVAIGGPDLGAPPRQGEVAARDLFAGSSLRGELAACRTFSAACRASPAPHHASGAPPHGFTLTTPFQAAEAGAEEAGAEDPALPHLALWLDTRGLASEYIEMAASVLDAIVGGAIERGGALSGLVASWDWTPSYGADATPYERACGVQGPTMRRSWCERFLHGVAGRGVWLGERLVEQLGDTAPLRAVAEVRPAGRGLSARTADLDALERALAPLLPGPEDR